MPLDAKRLFELDERFARAGMPLHQRPLAAAAELLGLKGLDVLVRDPRVAPICRAYEQLMPGAEESWPGMAVGLVAALDRVRPVSLAVGYGMPNVALWQLAGFASEADWALWCRLDHTVAAQGELALADLFDFAYGMDDLHRLGGTGDAWSLWQMAAAFLEDVARILPRAFNVDAVLQPICLTAEMALKAALVMLGMTTEVLQQRRYGHHLKALVTELVARRPHRDDDLLKVCIGRFPDLVNARYSPRGLARLQVVELAQAAQFIAATSVRRHAERDLAAEVLSAQGQAVRAPWFGNPGT